MTTYTYSQIVDSSTINFDPTTDDLDGNGSFNAALDFSIQIVGSSATGATYHGADSTIQIG